MHSNVLTCMLLPSSASAAEKDMQELVAIENALYAVPLFVVSDPYPSPGVFSPFSDL